MKTTRWMAAGLVMVGMMAGSCGWAQNTSMQTTQTTTSTSTQGAQTWDMQQLITSSVHDAWVMSGRNEATFFQMVTQLAELSAQKRGLTLPNSEAAGQRFGQLVKTMAKADHDQLLYVVVDKAVQQVGTKS